MEMEMTSNKPSVYEDSLKKAERVYTSLLKEIENSDNIYVGGIKAEVEAEFLAKIYPSLIFVDDYRVGSKFLGREVISTNEMAKRVRSSDFLINNCITVNGFNHFRRQAESLGIPSCSLVEVLAPHYKNGMVMDFPGMISVYGPSFHDYSFRNIDTYYRIREYLEDNLSLRTFDSLINYRLTGDPNFLYSVAVGHNYGSIRHDSYILNAQFFNLSDNEVFIDAGALDGTSSRFFVESVGGDFKKIIMFEPSSESVKRCQETIEAMDVNFPGKSIKDKIEIAELGLYNYEGTLKLAKSLYSKEVTEKHGEMPQSAHIIDTGISSAFVEDGDQYNITEVPITTLDSYIGENKVTFIKFEIEGSEVAALEGATKTIKRNKPKMALSIYHRPQDLELIIDYVRNLQDGYKFALRAHNPYCPDAIVLYCWI